MELGNFLISLAVKDIEASRAFYEKFGFNVFGGDAAQNWLILKNGDHAGHPIVHRVAMKPKPTNRSRRTAAEAANPVPKRYVSKRMTL